MQKDRDEVIALLVENQYDRNDIDFSRGTFRVHGDVLEIFPVGQQSKAIRLEFFGDEIDRISEFDPVTGVVSANLAHVLIFPATHYAVSRQQLDRQIDVIEQDLHKQVELFRREDKLLEAQRLEQRTNYDIEMLREIGFCTGIENYSRYFDGRQPGQAPFTLLDYFPKDFLLMRRRIPRHPPAGARDVRRGLRPQKDAWWNTASACPPPLTTGRCALRSSSRRSVSASLSPPRPAPTKWRPRGRWWNRSSAPRG